MKRKKQRKAEKPLKSRKESTIQRTEPPTQDTTRKDEWDFGGLPPRDLKKNLGCG